MEKKIVITKLDYERLKKYLSSGAVASAPHLKQLALEVENGIVVEPSKIDGSVVTMNSEAEVRDLQSGDVDRYRLVWPENANVSENRISIIAPLGAALLGYREGDEIELTAPSGIRRVKIIKIHYQPEADGKYDL